MNTKRPIRDGDVDIRSLRAFVAVAEELSFTRAADRLSIAQQVISREIRRLEDLLGTRLFVRTTRHVTLTAEGERLLLRARDLIALHDQLVDAVGPSTRPIVLDLMSEGRLTGPRILAAIRAMAPEREFRGRYGHGPGAALRQLMTGELDFALGRARRRGHRLPAGIATRLVRWEPLGVLLPATHPLASVEAVPVAALAGMEIDADPADPNAPEWSDLVVQFLELSGARPTAPHLAAIGLENQADHLVRQGIPILTGVDQTELPGGVLRPLVDPVPVFPWSMLWRRGLDAGVLRVVTRAIAAVAAEHGWLELPDDAWIPGPESARPKQPRR